MNTARIGLIKFPNSLRESEIGLRIIAKLYSKIFPVHVSFKPATDEFVVIGISYDESFMEASENAPPTYAMWYDDLDNDIWFEMTDE